MEIFRMRVLETRFQMGIFAPEGDRKLKLLYENLHSSYSLSTVFKMII
jgi:hypothetical protein